MSGSVAFFAFALPALAQVDLGLDYATQIGLTTTDIRTTVARIISYFLGFLGILAVGIMLYAGFLWMTAGGSEEKVQTAKKWMINGVIGLVIIMSAFAITQFILRAITGETLGTEGGCLEGQECGPPGGVGGSAGGFRVSGTAPAGPGPQNGGWPKNYSITVGFNSEVSAGSVTASSFIVKKCNARINGGGEAQPFVLGDCSEAVSGTRAVEGTRVVFKPNATPGDDPTDFEGEFWYYLQVVGGTVQDTRGRTLLCPSVTGDISAQNAPGNLCDRAIAINNLRDVAPPTVEVTVPRSMPAYCAATIPVQAIGRDDFLVSRIDFSLDGGSANISETTSVNGALANPFSVDQITIDASGLEIGEHRLAATAFDGVPQQSPLAESRFIVPPANCCNNVQDPNEEGIDCGPVSGCGECNGSSCTNDDDCQSGFCENGVCAERPIILTVSPSNAGPGSLVTIRGQFFGAAEGQVIFMGEPTDTGDDKVAAACADGAWRDLSPEDPGMFEVVVAVPEGAVSGPLKLVTAAGRSDTTELAAPPGAVLDFEVTDETLPGICRLTPASGAAGSNVVISGTGFQDAQPNGALVTMGSQDVTVAGGGWSATAITGIVPSIRDGAYPVKVAIGGDESNTVNFAIRPAAGSQKPEITAIVPDNAPPNAYITIQGRGFGSAGTVRFFFGTDNPNTGPDERDVAVGSVPACSDYWHNNYVVIKVPENYTTNPTQGILRDIHQVQIETVGPPQSSNLVDFTIINGTAGPGICSIMPPAGPAGVPVTLTGEGFGNLAPADAGENTVPLNVVRFFKSATLSEPATLYGTWTLGAIGAVVPGITADPDTWPKTGPVSIVAANEPSSNSVPFTVADCNAVGGDAFCKQQSSDLVCCGTGACDLRCGPEARVSSFGWRFSTDVLPALPRVVERSTCSVSPPTIQSPSPYKNSQDACINAAVRFLFNTEMASNTFTPDTVTLEDCGDDDNAVCPGTPDLVDYSGVMTSGDTIYRLSPSDPLVRKHWYRATLLSAPPAGITDALGRALDGDANDVPGGNYSYVFRVRDSDQACALSTIAVLPSKYNVDHQGPPVSVSTSGNDPSGFFSDLQAGNCNPLVCNVSGADQYAIEWGVAAAVDDEEALTLTPPSAAPAGFCDSQWQPVTATRETQSPSGIRLISEGRRIADQLSRSGFSTVSVKFSDPVVSAYAPNCDEACVNARIYAMFNISMNGTGNDGAAGTTITSSTVKLIRCRNEACNPPYDIIPTGLLMVTEPVDGFDLVRGVELQPANLEPDTFYLVRLRGGDDGIKSSSDVPLKGLNDGEYFTWKFRTKNDATPCNPNRSEVSPRTAILQYDTQRLPFKVTPFGAPDECDALGQALRSDDYNWQWSKTDQVIAGFLPSEFIPASRVNTEPGQNASCTAACLNVGSQNVEPQCGNGIPEDGEDCETADGNDCDLETCLWKGFSAPACGNGTPDAGEQCDQKACVGGTNAEAVCSSDTDCLGGVCGFIPGCKDPSIDLDGRSELDGKGCVWIGATAGGASCGDGFIADGESCDDGNTANGDGCSVDCVNEGTLPSCSTGVTPCVNFCGNGISEAGEDSGCDLGPNNVSSSCDRATCLKKGTAACSGGVSVNCCGNAQVEAGEECDGTEGCTTKCLNAGSSFLYTTPSFCRDGLTGIGEEVRCEVPDVTDTNVDPFQVIVGREPIAGGPGAPAASFISTVTSTLPEITNPLNEGKAEVTLSRPCTTADQGICAEIGGAMVPPVALGCTPDGFCAAAPEVSSIYPGNGARDVCRNTVVRISFSRAMKAISIQNNMQVGVETPSGDCGFVCSNDNGRLCAVNADCGGDGQCNVPRPTVGVTVARAPEAAQGWFARLWGRIVSFLNGLFARFAFAQAAPTPDTGATYCLVPGEISVVGGVATWSPRNVLAEDTWLRVFVRGGDTDAAVASNTVPLQSSYTSYFATGPEICRIDSVSVDPGSHLFSTAEDLGSGTPQDALDGDHPFTARAHPSGREPEAEIATTEEYSFKWRWSLQPTAGPNASSIVVIPQNESVPPLTTNGWCEFGEAPASPDCSVVLASTPAPKPAAGCGNEVCEVGETAVSCASDCSYTPPGHDPVALVKVRTGLCTNDPARACNTNADCGAGACQADQVFPKNGDEVVQVTADISERRVQKSHVSASADVIVLLCSNPWPARKFCPTSGLDTGRVHLTWDPGVDGPDPGTEPDGIACDPGTYVWHPFYDKDRDTSFYYCRDTQSSGDAGDLLPELKESVVSVTPGRDVLREYLFTFLTPGPWQKDAVGFRIVRNDDHKGIRTWYKNQGFRGAPSESTVDGYDALQEGRTVYVDAGARVGSSLYTNVNILSYSDAASPETVNIFNQFLGSIDLNRNVKDLNYCLDGAGSQVTVKACVGGPFSGQACTKHAECWEGTDDEATCEPKAGQTPFPITCTSDQECRVGADGKVLALRGPVCANDESRTCTSDAGCNGGAKCLSGYSCVASKSKLIRDVARWRDIHVMRDALLVAKREGTLPTLESGSFLRARSNSQWPSWTALAGAVGGKPPLDPVNAHLGCTGSGFDPVTCWNATSRLYQCPKDSHVYEFQSIGGEDFRLRVDFEARCDQYKSEVACEADPQGFCSWNVASCQASASWAGSTCVEKKTQPACNANTQCVWDAPNSSCLYKEGTLELGGVNNIAGICQSTTVSSETGICGDSVVQSGEQCEPSTPADIGSCTVEFVCDKERGRSCANTSDVVTCGTQGPCIDVANRGGTQRRTCTLSCTWGSFDACRAGVCGDGVIQSPENCDDGVQNGTFGHCLSDCTDFGPRCGDGQKEVNEACDCGQKNGTYEFNGHLTGVNVNTCRVAYPLDPSVLLNSCSWDCSGPGPYCGDGLINGPEQCDGGFEEFKGFCDGPAMDGTGDPLQTGCDSNAQCNFGTCSPTGSPRRCTNNQSITCTADTDCAKTCGHYCGTVEQRNRRACGDPSDPPDTQVNDLRPPLATYTADDPGPGRDPARDADIGKACRWSGWSCTAPGSCGNGTKETGEECDDGNDDNTDGCIIDPANGYFCKIARCADTYVSPANFETCDLGVNNGKICPPQYGLECNYCTSQCKTGTVSGGFCGNNIIEDGTKVPPGPEECEGTQGMSDWICLSTKVEDLSIGKVFTGPGNPKCNIQNCRRTCDEPQTKLCYNNPGSANSDRVGGYVYPESGTVLRDACDPDVDNDAVPGVFDCNDTTTAVHPDYLYTKPAGQDCPAQAPLDGGQCHAPAAVEVCDGLDNDCNGQTDNVVLINGQIVNAQSGAGVSGALMIAYCAGVEVSRATTDGSGNYSVPVVKDSRLNTCNGGDLDIIGSKSGFCFHITQAVRASISTATTCTPVPVPRIEMISDPPIGNYTAVLTWSGAGDMTTHVRASYAAGAACYADHTTGAGCTANGLCLDVNATVAPGPETYTINLRTPARYRYYVTGPSNVRNTGGVVRLWGNGCSHQLWKIADAGVRSGYTEATNWWEVFRIENVSGFSVTTQNLLGSSDPPAPNNCTNF